MSAAFPSLDPPIDESIYALIGAGAMMTGFSRITISLCVIMIEITQSNITSFPA
jgi:H+/Cl- antiporter ClcA